ncbi:ABC transporter G family member 15 [Bienertia sinuspersici]
MPFVFLVYVIHGAITYYILGFQKEYSHFIYYTLVLFACMMLVESVMMIVTSLVFNFLMGIITGAGILGLILLVVGFFRLPNDFPMIFWRYPLYYTSFHKYAFQGLFKNEFQGLEFTRKDGCSCSNMIVGFQVLNDTWQVETKSSKWINLAILFGMVILYRIFFLIIIKTSENIEPMIRALTRRSPKQVVQVDY